MSENDANSRDPVSRLFLLADRLLGSLERRSLEAGEDISQADSEKEARTMISLTGLVEKLRKMRESDSIKGSDTDEAERICRDLADRIERLQKQEKRRSRQARRQNQ